MSILFIKDHARIFPAETRLLHLREQGPGAQDVLASTGLVPAIMLPMPLAWPDPNSATDISSHLFLT